MLYIILGLILGFTFSKLVSGKYEGHNIEKSLRFLVNDHYIHIHHWMWCLLLVSFLWLLGFEYLFVYGILIGSIVHGLSYKDRFILTYHKNDFHRKYLKYKRYAKHHGSTAPIK